jgi:nicotinamidase-related amidase
MNKSAVLILDFINDIVHLKGKFTATANFVHEHHVIDCANKVISKARQQSIPLIFVRVGFSEGYLECPMNSPLFKKAKEYKALQLNSWGTEFYENLDYQPQDFVVTKHRVSALYATSLETFLKANQIQHLILTGVSTDMAVQTTAREAHDRDYNVTIVSDACGTESMEFHVCTLKALEHIATILTSNELKF